MSGPSPDALSLGAGLEGAGVLVTGAAGGIGAAVADAFARCGARVVATDLSEERAAEVAAALPGEGHFGLGADIGDLAAHAGLIDSAEDAVGPLVVLAHLAAVLTRRHQLIEIDEADWDAQVDVNFKATFFLNRAFAERCVARAAQGAIVNFSSQGWWTGGFGGSVVYNATKGGIVTLTRGLARSYGASGIRVNSVAPGLVDTSMLRDGLSDEALQRLVEQVPLARMATPAEIAPAVVFLASSHASYITGATLNISGGWLMY